MAVLITVSGVKQLCSAFMNITTLEEALVEMNALTVGVPVFT